MANKKIPQVHDAFFKQGLSHPGVSKDFLKAHLKEKAIKMIDWKVSPTLTNTNFVGLSQKSVIILYCHVERSETSQKVALEPI